MKYIDAHCHIQFDDYAEDRKALIGRMAEREVAGVVVGVEYASSEQAVALASMHEHLYAAVGLHPNNVGTEAFDSGAYRALAAHPKVVAIGECGLDFYRPTELTEEVRRAQLGTLSAQVELAVLCDLPLIIHARPTKGTQNAYHDLIALLKEKKAVHGATLRGDIHFFVGGIEEAQALIALGFTLSFTAVITFTSDYDAVIRAVPLTSILSETDAPYVAPAGRRGTRNDPLAVEDVVAQIARVRGVSEEEVRMAVAHNAEKLFGLAALN